MSVPEEQVFEGFEDLLAAPEAPPEQAPAVSPGFEDLLTMTGPGSVPEPGNLTGEDIKAGLVKTGEFLVDRAIEGGKAVTGMTAADAVAQPVIDFASLKSRDIDTQGAPGFARVLAALTPQRGTEGIEEALSTFYKQEVKVTVDKETGARVYKHPETGVMTTFDSPLPEGIDDVVDLIPELAVIIPEVAGFFAGTALTGGPVGGIGGASLGAFAGEFARLHAGKIAGAHNMTETQMYAQAAKVAGISAAGGAAGTGLVSFGRGIIRSMGSPSAEPGISQLDVSKVAESQQILNPINQATGRNARFNAAQATQDPLVALEQKNVARQDTRAFRQFHEQDKDLQDALIEFYDGNAEKVLKEGAEDPFLTGQGIKDVVQNKQERAVTRIEQKIDSTENQLDDTLSFADNQVDALSMGGGQQAKDIVRAELQASKARINAKKDQLNNVAREEIADFERPIIAEDIEKTALKINAQQRNNILNTLDPDDRRLEGKVLEALNERGAGGASFGTMTFEEAAETLSYLKLLRRRIDDGVETNVDIGAVKQMIGAFERDIATSLQSHPKTAIAYEDFRNLVFQEKERLNRNAVSRILRTRSDGSSKVLDEDAVKTVLDKEESALRMAEILRADRTLMPAEQRELYDTGLQVMRDGIKQRYQKAVLSGDKPNQRAHRKFLDENKNILKAYFSREELAKFNQIGELSKRVDELADAQKNLQKKFKGSRMGVLAAGQKDPRKIFQNFWNKGEVTDVIALKRQLREFPELWEEFKATAQSQMRNDLIQARGKDQVDIINPDALKTLLKNKSRQLTVIYGKEYVDNLNVLLRATQRANKVVKPGDRSTEGSPYVDLARAYFRPLSARGKIFTSALKLRRKAFETAFIEALADPRKLEVMVKLNRVARNSTTAAGLLGQLGAYSLIPDDSAFAEDVGVLEGVLSNTFGQSL